MWFDQSRTNRNWSAGRRHLARVDPVMKKIIARVGPCTLAPRRDYFVVLCKSIYTQQISTRIATILFGRFREQFPQKRPTPQRVLELLDGHHADEETIRRVGLSRQKKKYLIDLAQHFVDGRVPTRSFSGMSDEQIIESLTRVNGIGRWTAEMFLIFVLNRPDAWPVDDLGLAEAVKVAYDLPTRPRPRELAPLGEGFRPHRTLATWYLWRSLAS
jgi:DNA-3-methyladenine glycosylase II